MKTAHPASLPPGVCGSDGMIRSTIASIALASSTVKNFQGPGRSMCGADEGYGAQGTWPWITEARVNDVVPANQNVAEIRKRRRCSIWVSPDAPRTRQGLAGVLLVAGPKVFIYC